MFSYHQQIYAAQTTVSLHHVDLSLCVFCQTSCISRPIWATQTFFYIFLYNRSFSDRNKLKISKILIVNIVCFFVKKTIHISHKNMEGLDKVVKTYFWFVNPIMMTRIVSNAVGMKCTMYSFFSIYSQ